MYFAVPILTVGQTRDGIFLPSLLGKKPINILYDITIRERQSANAS